MAKLTLVSLFVLMYALPVGTVQTQASTVLVSAAEVRNQLTALTPDVVSEQPNKVTIKVTQSEYQKEQASHQAKLAAIVLVNTRTSEPSHAEKMAWVQKAAAASGIDWRLLAAVWQVESGQTWYTNRTSYAGAVGPCQFLPSTWRGYATDGNGDGVKNIDDARDCLFGAAKLLAGGGAASGNNESALLRYNHSLAYVQKVLTIAKSIQG